MAYIHWAFVALVIQSALRLALAQDAGAVVSELAIGDVKVVVKAADGSAISTLTGAYPKSVLANPEIPATASLDVTVAVKKGGEPFKPQQVMLMLKSKSLGLAAYAVGKFKSGSYVLSINAAAVEKQIGKLPGEYDITLLVGDPSAKGVEYLLGTAELRFSAASTAAQPATVVRTAFFQPVNNIKPEIHHIFRAPEKRPPALVSYVFAGLAFVPLAAVLVYVPTIPGVNLKGWTTAPLYSVLFHGGLGGMLLLYMMFWLRLNLAQTLPMAGIWGLFVAGSGFLLLSSLSKQRLKKDQ
ncbi:hypothetical protein VOLCADRAFT_103997 [Volvox carteri f. nagariensis]|uniref:Ribophorin II n=1 Tax=Volvox carteri f. nagariensis TaxID=3068 RepID=D8TQJ2_VOLCA|nr:uncharacterized protein VOLCADRAFT_103997 [Volvox carteri f. nagariensis]EFJ50162.1 hypothetical protein VOLCADRAFT_103997 [Volvox carteri f. nagariensis]|eukprot:XP_002948782.1 hypothetical protein VOLCADRAFT_103997 [Volvox carteri f. nagariensis]